MTDAKVLDTDIYVTRVFNAPREVVWKFWTTPELVAQWFGPENVHVPVESVDIDLRVGGNWNLTMVDNATGAEYPLEAEITVLTPPEYLEGHVANASSGDITDIAMRVTFHDHGDRTRVTLHQGPFTDEQKKQTSVGWEESWIALDALLEGTNR